MVVVRSKYARETFPRPITDLFGCHHPSRTILEAAEKINCAWYCTLHY